MVQAAATMEFDEQHGFIERRAGQRHVSVFRVGRIVIAGRDQLCVVRNVSEGGMLVEATRLPEIGATVQLELRSDRQFQAEVRWRGERTAGIMFADDVDVAWLLKEERQSIRRVQPRAPRFVRDGRARIVNGGAQVSEGDISNISINGIAIRTPDRFGKDEPVVVAIEGLGATHAFARWSVDGETGLRLQSPLSYRALADWLDVHEAFTG